MDQDSGEPRVPNRFGLGVAVGGVVGASTCDDTSFRGQVFLLSQSPASIPGIYPVPSLGCYSRASLRYWGLAGRLAGIVFG